MGTTSSAIFTGSSQFSQDFQNVITRAVNIASLPISQLNGDLASLQNQSTALTGLDTTFAALQSAVAGIDDAMSGSSFETSISDESVVSVTLGSGVAEGNYSIEVKDAGAYSSGLTKSWVNKTNPAGTLHTYQLYVNGAEYDVTPADNSAASVAAAINARAGDKVHATAVNVGPDASPDYRIALQSTALGNSSLDLKDAGVSLEQQSTAGWAAQYVVNNSGVIATSNSRSVTIAPGVTVNLLASAPGDPVDITLIRSTTALGNALATFASAYNDAKTAVAAQHGQPSSHSSGAANGVLNGQSIVYALDRVLRQIATYSPQNGQISGLADLGLSLGLDGKLTFSPLSLMGADLANPAGVTAFFGSATAGGFLKSATDALNSLEDSATGLIKTAESGVETHITNTNARINAKQVQVDQLQMQLEQQMSAADAAIASMEQQYSYLSSMFQAQQTAALQYSK